MPKTLPRITQLQLDKTELHFARSCFNAMISTYAGHIGGAIQFQLAAHAWIEELGEDKVLALMTRINQLHDSICPNEEDN